MRKQEKGRGKFALLQGYLRWVLSLIPWGRGKAQDSLLTIKFRNQFFSGNQS